MLVLLVCVLILNANCRTLGNDAEENISELFQNLIENLRSDPYLTADVEFTNSAKEFVDKQIDNFVSLMSRYDSIQRSKRSLSEESGDGSVLDLIPLGNIPASFPKDIRLFRQNSEWYATTLENATEAEGANVIVIRKYENNTFAFHTQASITSGVKMATFSLPSSTLIVVAENASRHENFEHLTKIFEFTSNGKLEIIQRMSSSYATDVAIWADKKDIFMTAAQFMKETGNETTFEVEMPVYKWQGKHFDVIQHVKAYGATSITAFSVGDMSYVALANSRSKDDNGKMHSELFKYNLQSEKYEVFQRLLTNACKDVEYFKANVNNVEEHFIVTANSYYTPYTGDSNYNTSSIIYKLVDNYFIPFHSIHLRDVKEWQPIRMDNGDVILLALTLDGLQCLQYDGWRFEKCKINFLNGTSDYRDIKTMHYEKFLDKNVLVLVTQDFEHNIFEVNFSRENKLKNEHDKMLSWCMDNVRHIDSMNDEYVLGDPVRGDISEEIQGESQTEASDEERFVHTLNKHEQQLSAIESKLQNSFQTNSTHTIDYDLNVTSLVVNDASAADLDVQTFNSFQVQDMLDNVLNVNNGFNLTFAEFDSLRLAEPLTVQSLNSIPVSDILRSSGNVDTNELVVTGSATFNGGVEVVDTVNGINIKEDSVLLRDEPQTFINLTAKNLVINSLKTAALNGQNLTSEAPGNGTRNPDALTVKNLTVRGYVNGMDIPTLYKYALRSSGDQDITGNYYFDHVEAEDLTTRSFSGQTVEDFIVVTEGSYKIRKDVQFSKDVSAVNLTALEFLNSIPVKDNTLDLLLRTTAEPQYISGMKSFENLELLNSIKLRGKIRGKDFNIMNPLVTVDRDLDLSGDVEITGDVRVEESMKASDVVSSDGANSLERVQKEGLKLTDAEIPILLGFSQHITVEEMFAERINNMEPAQWVVNGAKQTQAVKGWKTFQGDLEITGNTDVFRINDIDMEELDTNVLRREGDQVIRGKHYVKYVAAEKSINSNTTTFGTNSWRDVVTTADDQVISGTTTFRKNVKATSISTNNIKLMGLANNQDIQAVFNDAVTVGDSKEFKISGHKFFGNITIRNLEKKEDLQVLNAIEEKTIILPELDLNSLSVRHIHFDKTFNGMNKTQVMDAISEETWEWTVREDRQFDNVKVFGNVYLESNFINELNMDDFVNNTVKIDEPFHFEFVEFGNDVIVNEGIQLKGHVENLDLENIFQNGINQPQKLVDQKIFHENVSVNGTTHFSGLLNGVSMSKLCDFVEPSQEEKTFILNGNSYFGKGPIVNNINGEDVQTIGDALWFSDRYTVINESVQINNGITFDDIVTMTGLLNDWSLDSLQKNYLSKTKDQTITARFSFEETVRFLDDLATPELLINGKINGIKIEEFTRDVLMHRPQLFENRVYFDSCKTNDISGEYLVNNLSIENDVMRYDKPNMVTGVKQFSSIQIDTLKAERNVSVQGVDVTYFLRNAVLTGGSFNIPGTKTFSNASVEKGISLIGKLNGLSFDRETIMLKHSPQNITGTKAFMHKATGADVKFKALKVKGLVNNADIGELVENQASKNGNIFRSGLAFHNNITVKNINLEGLYHGINVSELLMNMTNLESLNNFRDNYRSLLESSEAIERSLADKAFYLHDFRPILSVPYGDIFCISDGGKAKMVQFTQEEGSTIVRFLTWNDDRKVFEDIEGYSMNLGEYHPNYLRQVNLGNQDYIYIEHPLAALSDDEATHEGKLLHFDINNTTNFRHQPFITKGTVHLTAFELEELGEECLLFVDFNLDINIVCKNSDEEYGLRQTINTEKAHMASILHIDDSVYMVTIRKGSESYEPRTTLWKYNVSSSQFETYQNIYEGEPISLATISAPQGHFFAVAYGYVRSTMDFGKILIKKYNRQLAKFTPWQNIKMKTPTQTEFALLPSGELALYVVTENPVAPFGVYQYEGISGFVEKMVARVVPNVVQMNQFSADNQHFVTLQDHEVITLVQAVFKGGRVEREV